MSILKNLFVRSPFSPLQSHMEKVASCVQKADELFDAYFNHDYASMETLAEEISELEHSADLTKMKSGTICQPGFFGC